VSLAPQSDDWVLETTSSPLGSGTRRDHTVRASRDTHVGRVSIPITELFLPGRILEQGYQSWSVVRRCEPGDFRPERADLPDTARGMHQADPDDAGHRVGGDQVLVTDWGVVGWLDGSRHFGTVTVDPGDGSVWATALLDDIPLAAGETVSLAPLWVAHGDPGDLYSECIGHWAAEGEARASAPAPVGWCSWYRYFGDVTPGDIRSNLAPCAAHGIELVQIDDGYQAAIGDWLDGAPGWEGEVERLAAEITAAGCQPGIWTAPFLVGESSRLYAEHPDWVARHHSGHPLRAAYNLDGWGGWTFALDTTVPEVLNHLRTTYAALTALGYRYHKIDFCYAAALVGERRDETKTRAQSLRAGLEAVRDGIGDDSFLLGCGCPFGPAVGVVDAMRVSADVAPRWEPEQHWPGYRESAPAAVNAIQASLLRAPMHRRLWINDPDCLLLTRLPTDERDRLADAVMAAGAFTVLSDDLATYGPDEWAVVDRVRAAMADRDRRLDIDDPFTSGETLVISGTKAGWRR
jgi:alpha-galactosidase